MKGIKTLNWFRKIAIAEGISFLVLLGIAMPLKYFADMPMGVKIVGYIHGFLFIAFVLLAWETKNSLNKSFGWFGLAFLASLLPFGTFVLDRELKKDEALLIK
ncbi:MAG: DUF3817 domain-containing protein [Ferruginibacter sp.]